MSDNAPLKKSASTSPLLVIGIGVSLLFSSSNAAGFDYFGIGRGITQILFYLLAVVALPSIIRLCEDKRFRQLLWLLYVGVVCFPILLLPNSGPSSRDYKEDVGSIMVSKDEKYIVLFGSNHHYILDMPSRLLEILNSPWRNRLEWNLQRFVVAPDRSVSGVIFIRIDMKLDSQETIQSIGKLISFRPRAVGHERYATSESIEIRGKRYNSARDIHPGPSQKLNRPYTFMLHEWPANDKEKSHHESPIKKLSDGALSVFGIPLGDHILAADSF